MEYITKVIIFNCIYSLRNRTVKGISSEKILHNEYIYIYIYIYYSYVYMFKYIYIYIYIYICVCISVKYINNSSPIHVTENAP